jgi:hypothetical protein
MNRGWACVGLASLLLLAGTRTTFAQQRPGTEIRHFFGVPWGATGDQIATAFGPPYMDQLAPDSVRVIIYKEEVQSVPVFRLFYLDPKLGLVKGVHTIPYGPGSDCEVVFGRLKERMQQMYPALKPSESRRHGDPKASFCESAASGDASWRVRWDDPVSKNSVEMMIEPEGGHVDIVYQSSAFKAVKP